MESSNFIQDTEGDDKIFSVSEFITLLNIGLKKAKAKIIGEVGKVDIGPTGHVYFSLWDENGQGIINCIIWKSRYAIYGVELKEGAKIISYGYPEIYPPKGTFSFIAETIELAGEGALKKEYDKLKEKLSKEGVFAENRKKPIPKYPQKIGVITSRQGAVIADFLNNIGRFGFKIKMIDSRVEGQSAVEDLLLSIKTFKKQGIDVLVIIRGGGSMESMMPFNNEMLVRELVDFPVPVIAGIGHHKDEPLVALAADISVSTPTAAANLLNESWQQAIFLLERSERAIIDCYSKQLSMAGNSISQSIGRIFEIGNFIIGKYKKAENSLRVSLQNFKNSIKNVKIGLRDSQNQYLSRFKASLLTINQLILHSERVVLFNDPERQLRLGYAIAAIDGKIIRKTTDVSIGKKVDIKVIDGIIESKVINVNEAPCAKSAGYLERNSSVAEYPPSLLATGSELRKGYSPRLHPCGETAGYSAKENKKNPSPGKELQPSLFRSKNKNA